MKPFDQMLKSELAGIESSGLGRQLDSIDSRSGVNLLINGRSFLNFSSNDYLGLAHHPALVEAAVRAAERWGAGAGASRLICGSLGIHRELEEELAHFKRTDAALSFGSGYATALGTLGALSSPDDVVVLDKRVHACCVDAARLSRARLRVFRHNDLNDLESILKWSRNRPTATGSRPVRVLVLTESIFSMDGDRAPLRELVELKDRYGAWLMLDEAHATGILGERGAGLAQEPGLADRIEIQMGTLGKALGAEGGFIAGSRPLVDVLINRARTFLFSTAPAPAAAGAALAGVRLAQSEDGTARRVALWERVQQLNDALAARVTPPISASPSPIAPWIIGDERKAVGTAAQLHQGGVFARAVRFPTVARGQARIRFTVTSDHTPAHFRVLATALDSCAQPPAPVP